MLALLYLFLRSSNSSVTLSGLSFRWRSCSIGQLSSVVWLIRRRSFSFDNLKLTPMQVILSCFPTFVLGAKRISLLLLCSTLDIRELKEGMGVDNVSLLASLEAPR